MDFCSIHFGKSLHNLVYEDIAQFFTISRIESDQLEFKSLASDYEKQYPYIIETICGFLNSKGGLLIWGAPREDKASRAIAGQLTPISAKFVKDQIISKCSDYISPLPQGIKVAVLNDNLEENICVFEIDESEYAPHQYSGVYYMRIDGQTKKAPHHYVEALFKRIRYPNLECYLKIKSAIYSSYGPLAKFGEVYIINFDLYFFNWSPYQNEEFFSFTVLTNGFFPKSQNEPSLKTRGYSENGSQYYQNPFMEVFRLGESQSISNTIIIEPINVGNDYKLTIVISFGGKFSPTKFSRYEIDLSKLNDQKLTRYVNQNPGILLSSMSENELAKDYQERKGASRESTLKAILGR